MEVRVEPPKPWLENCRRGCGGKSQSFWGAGPTTADRLHNWGVIAKSATRWNTQSVKLYTLKWVQDGKHHPSVVSLTQPSSCHPAPTAKYY